MINRSARLLTFVYTLCIATSVVVAQTSSPVSPPSETSYIPPPPNPPAVANPCHWTGQALNSNGCSAQAAYLITEISPILCAAGSFYAPSGVVSVSVVGTVFNLCPAPLANNPELCRTGPVPTSCSVASKKIANIPNACGNEQYYGNPGFFFDGNGCPSVAVAPVAAPAPGSGTSSGSYSNGPCFWDGSGRTLTATGCSAQAAYFITQLTPIFCPAGSTFAPNSVTVVGGALCPVPFSSSQINCKPRPIPSACSESAIKIANIPDLCGADLYSSILMTGTDTNGCPLHAVSSASPSGSVTSAPVQQPSASMPPPESNLLHLDFKTRHLCNLQPHDTRLVTRDCLAQNGMGVLVPDIMSQCSMLGSDATAASHAVCKLLISEWQTMNSIKLQSYHESLAILLGNDLNPLSVCLISPSSPTKPAMHNLLLAISQTESSDPRDSTATASNLLSLCFSSCKNSSTAVLLGLIALGKSAAPKQFPSFCTNSAMDLMWHLANNAPRECSDSLIASWQGNYHRDYTRLLELFGRNVTPCVLQTLLPAYVAMCDTTSIQCENYMHEITEAELSSCESVFETTGTCSSQCAALANRLSTHDLYRINSLDPINCFKNMWSIQEVIAQSSKETCGDSRAFVNSTMGRSDWQMRTAHLNTKCNLTKPFPPDLLEVKDPTINITTLSPNFFSHTFLDGAWESAFRSKLPAAFQIRNFPDDTRTILKDITRNFTVVFTASFSLTINTSDYQRLGQQNMDSALNNVSESALSGLQHVMHLRNWFVIFNESSAVGKPDSGGSQALLNFVALIVSFNHDWSRAFNIEEWSNYTINLFQSKASSIEIRNLVSSSTLQGHDPSTVMVIPPLRNPNMVFEFSAAPLLLQRLLNDNQLQNVNASFLQSWGFFSPNSANAVRFGSNPDNTLNSVINPLANPCKIDSFGPYNAGTLYAGDGIVIQQNYTLSAAHGIIANYSAECVATLRYSRSSFGPGNITFVWSRVRQFGQRHNALLIPDGTENMTDATFVDYGRISITVRNNSVTHSYPPEMVRVTDDEVFLNIEHSAAQNLLLYAVRRYKIDSFGIDAVSRLVPLQPNSKRRDVKISTSGLYQDQRLAPLDFSCSEFDLSSLAPGSRAVLSLISLGGFDPASSVMYSHYPPNHEFSMPVPATPSHCTSNQAAHMQAPCASYYRHGLYRQHTNTSAFRDLSPISGGATLVESGDIHVVCVSASDRSARSTLQDGQLLMRYQKKGQARACKTAPPASYATAPTTPPNAPSTTFSYQLKQPTGSAMSASIQPVGQLLVTNVVGGANHITLFGYVVAYYLSSNVTAAHIHGPASSGSEGPVVATICGPSPAAPCNVHPATDSTGWLQSLPMSGLVLNSTMWQNGLLYLNIRTEQNPGGELRGQLTNPYVPAPANSPSSTGAPAPSPTVYATYYQLNQLYGSAMSASIKPFGQLNVNNVVGDANHITLFGDVVAYYLSSNVTAAHIHGPASAPSEGPVVVTICGPSPAAPCNVHPVTDSSGHLQYWWRQSLPMSGLVLNSTMWQNGLLYLNIRTEQNPGGELRGQLTNPYVPAHANSPSSTGAPAPSPPLPGNADHFCESLSSDGLHFNEIPSSQCMVSGFQGTTLYDRSNNFDGEAFTSADEEVFDILLPFSFRWFGALYEKVFVSTNSYVTFGGGKSVFRDFSAFNPPLPSVLIGAFDNNLQRLIVGQVPQGWLVRFEGRTSIDDQPDENSNCCLGSSELVWELLFLRNGGLQLCTGAVKEYTGAPSSAPVSAVSHQKSASFAHTFVLKSNFQYTFTSTCAAENRASLSAPISSVTGATLNIMMHLSLNAINVSTWTITLRGAGFSCPPNATVSLISSPPTLLAAGVANILDSSSSSPVLVMSGIVGIINGSVMLSFTVPGVSTPHLPQGAISNLGFAVHDVSGRIVASGSTFKLDAISPYSTLEQTPLVELSVPTIRSEVSMKITVSPDPSTIIFGQSAPKALVITVSGSGWHFDPSSVTSWTATFGWKPVSASIVALGTSTHRIRIDFDLGTSRTISSITPLTVIIRAIQTPNVTQDSLSNISCSILNARDSILAAGNRGTLAAITASTMGLREPAISFSPPLRSINNSVLEVRMTPVFRVDFQNIPVFSQPPTPGPAVVITLSGQGISCPPNTPVTFLMPSTGASGVANIDSSVAKFPVLRVTITSGSFAAGAPIRFQVVNVSTPVLEQPDFNNVSAAMFGRHFGNTVLIAASVSGIIDRIVGDTNHSAPFPPPSTAF